MVKRLDVDYEDDDIPWCGLFTGHCVAASMPDEFLPTSVLHARALRDVCRVRDPEIWSHDGVLAKAQGQWLRPCRLLHPRRQLGGHGQGRSISTGPPAERPLADNRALAREPFGRGDRCRRRVLHKRDMYRQCPRVAPTDRCHHCHSRPPPALTMLPCTRGRSARMRFAPRRSSSTTSPLRASSFQIELDRGPEGWHHSSAIRSIRVSSFT